MSDEELIALVMKFKSGDLSQFDVFYEATKKQIYYNIFAVTNQKEASEDLLQDSYVKFLNSVNSLNDKQNPVAFLTIISRNLALDYLRKEKRLVHQGEEDDDSTFFGGVKDEDVVDDSDALFTEMKSILKPKEFEIVVLHVVNGMSHKDIAKLKNKPLGTILWSYSNAVKKLQKGLKGKYE